MITTMLKYENYCFCYYYYYRIVLTKLWKSRRVEKNSKFEWNKQWTLRSTRIENVITISLISILFFVLTRFIPSINNYYSLIKIQIFVEYYTEIILKSTLFKIEIFNLDVSEDRKYSKASQLQTLNEV